MLNEHDKESLKVKYEQFCYKYGIDSKVFDIDKEIDSSLQYWENWGIIEDKLQPLKEKNEYKLSQIKQMQKTDIHIGSANPLKIDLDKTDSIAILADRNQGKTNLAFYMLNNYRGTRDVYLYGYPIDFKGFKRVSTWSDLLKITDSIIFIDELQRFIKLYDRHANTELMELMNFLAHQKNTLIFTTSLSQFITKGVEASIQTWMLKRLDIMSLKNGSKPKRILNQIADARITDKGMAIDVDEVIVYDDTQKLGFNGVYSFNNQNVGKDWKTATKTENKTANKVATEYDDTKNYVS